MGHQNEDLQVCKLWLLAYIAFLNEETPSSSCLFEVQPVVACFLNYFEWFSVPTLRRAKIDVKCAQCATVRDVCQDTADTPREKMMNS